MNESKLIDDVTMKRFLKDLTQLQEKYQINIDSEIDYDFDRDWGGNTTVSVAGSYLVYTDKDGNVIPNNYTLTEIEEVDVVFVETPEPTSKLLKRETEKLIAELEHWKKLL